MGELFKRAIPIWIAGREQDVNLRVQFKTICSYGANAEIHIATSGIYQLWINGSFVAYGPARAGKNYFRMDNIPISKFLTKKENTVVIEVNGYNLDSYYIQNQPSFLQAEILISDEVVAVTGKDFIARINPYHYRKMQIYSWQRPIIESYGYTNPKDDFLTSVSVCESCKIIQTEKKNIIERFVPYPIYERIVPEKIYAGKVSYVEPKQYKVARGYNADGTSDRGGYDASELKYFLTSEYQRMRFEVTDSLENGYIDTHQFQAYSFSYNATGMLKTQIHCEEDAVFYVIFDEVLLDGKIDPLRMGSCNIIRYDLAEGIHNIQFFEVYTMKYVQFVVTKGKCTIEQIEMVEYKHPPIAFQIDGDEAIQKIVTAALETYRQCAVDLFMDCPSRERAGWLCDSYFTAKVEYVLTGKNTIEKSFLENFLHEENYANLPKGMLPMCYPADFRTGKFIPNWAMWLVIELNEYRVRTGDMEFIQRFKDKIYGLISYFSRFENEIGLLENLENWIFVEWSRANDRDLVEGINYPSNMLYYKALVSAYEMYQDAALWNKAEHIKEMINKHSYNGQFYVDHGNSINGEIVNTKDITEVCQYYAFFCGVATPKTHENLFETLINEFGPERDVETSYPEIYPAQPFIGNYLRLDIMANMGYTEKVVENIKGYFLYMANETGTLWEKALKTNSCNHGFASYVIYLLSICEKI